MIPMPMPRRVAAVSLMGLLVAACGAPTPTPSADPPSPTPPQTTVPTSAPPSDAPSPPASVSPTAVPIADDPPALTMQAVAGGLAAPIGIATGPPGWLLVQEQEGRVIAVDVDSGEAAVALDITDRVLGGGERGLLGLALHPKLAGENLRAFVHYSDANGNTVLSEFSVAEAGPPLRIDPASERVLLRVQQPFSNHNGGQLAFGPDGYLWFGLGDGGSGGDPLGNGQNPASLLGKILRLDVDAEPTGDREYAIPGDNPFADGADGAPEVALVGLRNPWRFSFDRGTNQLWIADVGQDALEEVDRVDPAAELGANLGWNRMEASACYLAGCSAEGLLLPVTEYGDDLGCSVTGGHVYRGSAIEGLAGWYLFSDYCSGLLFGIRSDAPVTAPGERAPAPRVLLRTDASVSSFGEDSDGELYVADHASGTIYRIVAAP